MAGVQFSGGKCHGAGEAKAMMRHACADERVNHTHSNEDIDTTKTANNSDIYGLSYKEMCSRYDERIRKYQDESTRKLRKDAVTLYDLVVSKPRDLPDDQEDKWYQDVAATIEKHYARGVVLDVKIHRDEIHDYTDPDTGKTVTSRTHGHVFCFPEVAGKLNAKQFSSRSNMTSLNREIDVMSRQKYHCAFITGEKAVDRQFQTVEQLKRASDAAEIERRIRADQKAIQANQKVIQAKQREISQLERTRGYLMTKSDVEAMDVRPQLFHRDRVSVPIDQLRDLGQTAAAHKSIAEHEAEAEQRLEGMQTAREERIRYEYEQKLQKAERQREDLQKAYAEQYETATRLQRFLQHAAERLPMLKKWRSLYLAWDRNRQDRDRTAELGQFEADHRLFKRGASTRSKDVRS